MSILKDTQLPKLQLNYRPEIDGLRAIAVLSVFIFHLNHNWLPGGFVGVDIFFVISGYLITSIIFNDLRSEKFCLLRFYQRRIARIFPALFMVALVTVVAASFVYSPQDLASAGANLVAATLSLANIKYMLQGSYFEISPDAQPFLHYWSLSVEEQFYMFFPLLLLFLYRFARHHLTLVLSLLGLVSLVACVLLTQVRPVWAFYLLPTRAWELCAGCLLAVIPFVNSEGQKVVFPRWIPAMGLLLLGGSFIFIQDGAQFPGWQAIFPVVGTVALILPGANLDSWVGKFLSSRPMISVGKVSYSLYLWHWPVFSLIDYRFYLWTFEARLFSKVGLTVLLTVCTFILIENPARVFLNQLVRRRFAYGAFATLVVLFTFLGVSVRQEFYINAKLSDVAKGGLVFAGEPESPSVVLMGDSNGSMYGRMMKRVCADLKYDLNVISVDAGDPLPSRDGRSDNLWKESLEAVRKTQPDFLVIAMAWNGKLHDDLDRLAIALNELKPHVGHILLLNQPPTLPAIANRASIRNGARPPFWEDQEIRATRLNINQYLLTLQSSNVTVIDVSQYFESDIGEVLFLDERGRQLYQDAGHLTDHGAERVRNALNHVLGRRNSS